LGAGIDRQFPDKHDIGEHACGTGSGECAGERRRADQLDRKPGRYPNDINFSRASSRHRAGGRRCTAACETAGPRNGG
jgi:hypothetical protein